LIPHDYHVHTDFSCDCKATMVAMCQAAVEKGIREIGFSEHLDLFPEDRCYASFRVEAWWEELARCREAFRGQLTIRAGIEVGETHRFRESMDEVIRRFPWDYVLGALHWVDSALVFDRAYFQRPADAAYLDYFRELRRLVEPGGFDVLAHMDIVKRYGFTYYGPYDPRRYEGEIRAVLRACAQQGIGLEINTSTLRRPIAVTSPDDLVLRWFREEGGEWVTMGSDAHLTADVGYGMEQVIGAVRAAGFDRLARYESRRPVALPLPKSGEA